MPRSCRSRHRGVDCSPDPCSAVQLVHKDVFPHVGSYYTLGAGKVMFHLDASVDGQGDAVIATNADKLSFYQVAGGVGSCPTAVSTCLVNRPFTIEYDDAFGGHWEVDFPTTTWKP